MRRASSLILYIALIAAFVWAIADAGRIAWSDWLAASNTPESVADAIHLSPGNASWHGLLAEHQEAAGLDPKPELTEASRLSPREGRYWARQAFRAEVEKNDNVAEKYLLRAAEEDRMFAPRWALANFYLRRGDARQGDMEQFWIWLGKCLEMPPPELGAIFQVAWAVAKDGEKVGSLLPRNPAVQRQYVAWLTENQPLPEVAKPALELAANSTAADLPALLGFCNRAAPLDSKSALQVWNELCRRKLLPFETLNPESGQVVTDGSFSKPPMKEGFGWTLLRETGASVSLGETGTGVAIRFGGKQAERTGLLLQRVPLVGRRHYRFTYEYRVAGNAGPTGIHWELLALPQDGDALHGEATLQATDWTTASQEFESPGTAAPRLMLFYQRKLGMLPWEGVVYVRKVSIEALP